MLHVAPASRLCERRSGNKNVDGMTDRDDFLAWVRTTLYEAELALHNGDAAPRRALWSRNEPVSVLGAWRNAHGQNELDELFTSLERSFSDCTSYAFELQAYDVVGDMAYTAGLEHTSASVDGQPRSYTLRATQVYRREGGEWKVAHRHGDTVIECRCLRRTYESAERRRRVSRWRDGLRTRFGTHMPGRSSNLWPMRTSWIQTAAKAAPSACCSASA